MKKFLIILLILAACLLIANPCTVKEIKNRLL